VATAGTDEGLALVTAQGARHALNHHREGYLDALSELTGGRGPDVILEMLANVNLAKDLRILAKGGRVVVIGNRGTIEINPRDAMSRDAAILGMTLVNATDAELVGIHAALGSGLENGTLRPVVGRKFSLAEAPKAHHAVMESGAYGKIVVVP
jgi:NADPH2:quinone reductase